MRPSNSPGGQRVGHQQLAGARCGTPCRPGARTGLTASGPRRSPGRARRGGRPTGWRWRGQYPADDPPGEPLRVQGGGLDPLAAGHADGGQADDGARGLGGAGRRVEVATGRAEPVAYPSVEQARQRRRRTRAGGPGRQSAPSRCWPTMRARVRWSSVTASAFGTSRVGTARVEQFVDGVVAAGRDRGVERLQILDQREDRDLLRLPAVGEVARPRSGEEVTTTCQPAAVNCSTVRR